MSCCYCCPGCFCLTETEQMFLEGLTGKEVIDGPGVRCIGPCWKGTKRNAHSIQQDQYLKVLNELNGERSIIPGPGLHFLGAFDAVENINSVIILDKTEYVIVNNISGDVWREVGPKRFIPGPYDTVSNKYRCVALKHNEFVKIKDNELGQLRIERGEGTVFLTPFEVFIKGREDNIVQKAVNIDEHTACLVRNTETGQLHLFKEKMLFFPTIHEEILKVQKKVVLKDHETAIIKDGDGNFHFMSGATGPRCSDSVREAILGKQQGGRKKKKDDEQLLDPMAEYYREVFGVGDGGRAFFVPPYCEMLELQWTHKHGKKKTIKTIDSRPHFLEYTFECRTSDNVELVLDVTFFWQVIDVEAMIEQTDDAPGDMCAHARSVTIQKISTLTMEVFMSNFNSILHDAILESDDSFYESRGCVIHTVEVKSYHCKDPKTEEVLQEIIKERTDRMNRLQKQESENEVRLFKMKGDIEEEKLHGELLKIRHSHHRTEAAMEGEAEADQLKMFLDGLGDIDPEVKKEFWSSLRKLDAIRQISKSNGHFTYTPPGADLTIGSFGTPFESSKKNSSRGLPSTGDLTTNTREHINKRDIEKRYDFSKFTNNN